MLADGPVVLHGKELLQPLQLLVHALEGQPADRGMAYIVARVIEALPLQGGQHSSQVPSGRPAEMNALVEVHWISPVIN